MKGKAEISLLLDYYGAYLTERQRELTRMSADEDMSLSEIAEQVGISRQAVRDSLSKAEKQLLSMEDELGLIDKDRRLRSAAELLKACCSSSSAEETKQLASKALEVLEESLRR